MKYFDTNFKNQADLLKIYIQLKTEYGSEKIEEIYNEVKKFFDDKIEQLKELPESKQIAIDSPNDLAEIKKLRTAGPRKLFDKLPKDFSKRMQGAFIGRMAGCTLGAPVEFWEIDKMKMLAQETNLCFPPDRYWKYVWQPFAKRYETSMVKEYTSEGMDGVPVDDDITYTILGLLILEEYGFNFTTENVGEAWVKYLPFACSAEDIALKNLRKGIPASRSAVVDNPFCEWIGADIRADAWGYVAAGNPELAAELAYRDAYLSHRRQGIYGEMFFAAAIAAAFAVNDPMEALKIALTEVPKTSQFYKDISWVFEIADTVKNYQEARDIVDEKFNGMHPVHTINNACLTIFGINIGRTNFTKVIGEVVAMGLDNDCTAATAGSIVGACIGIDNIDKHWYDKFNDKVKTYINGYPVLSISDCVARFEKLIAALH